MAALPPRRHNRRIVELSSRWRRALFGAAILLSMPFSSSLSYTRCLSSSRSIEKSSHLDLCMFSEDGYHRRIASKRRTSPTSRLHMRGNKKDAPIRGTAGVDSTNKDMSRLKAMKRETLRLLQEKNFSAALNTIKLMIATIERAGDVGEARISMSSIIDESIQAFTNLAFAQPFQGSATNERISQGLGAIHLQLSSTCLASPFDTMPRSTFVNGLKAVTGIITNENGNARLDGKSSSRPLDVAFRILQRLVTGRGVRPVAADQSLQLSERDFNMVLNAASHTGRLDMAHKIVALQERTPHAPTLSPVAYSILLKGYGRLGDVQNVRMILSHAELNGIEPDIIMLNSMIDAFVNCDEIETAQDIFRFMKDPQYQGNELSKFNTLLVSGSRPSPNRRTYNTVLKGLAKKGESDTAMKLSLEMKQNEMWDNVTTNTLVSAAVNANDFELAESLLANHTATLEPEKRPRKHPNVEAYTVLLDGYAKASQLQDALRVLELMNQRGINPNEYTYTCLIGAFARVRKVDQALKMLKVMESRALKPQVVTYNAFISGLLADESDNDPDADSSFILYATEALKLLPRMLKAGVRPNSVTISVLVDGLGRCEPPRLAEAKALVTKLRKDNVIAVDDLKVTTALIRTCGAANDLTGALENFRQLNNTDIVAVNAFLDACCRCGHEKLAFETFKHYFGKKSSKSMAPDVITYSVLIAALLQLGTPQSMQRVIVVYQEMRKKRLIPPDKALVDIILTAMVRGGRIGLNTRDIQFARTVLRDAEKLDWEPGQLEKRKAAVGAVLIGRVSEVWKEDERLYGMSGEEEDELFKKHGWNKVDSGFRLWGGGLGDAAIRNTKPGSGRVVDEFLASKGWNDVDSSFRLI